MATEKKPFQVLITHSYVLSALRDVLEPECEIITTDTENPKKDEILKFVKGADGIIWIGTTKLDGDILEEAGDSLKVVSTIVPSYEHVDILEARRRNIKVGFTPRVADNTVAELAIGLMLAAGRRFGEGRFRIEANSWDPTNLEWLYGQTFVDKVIGFYGFGGVGQAIAKRLIGFDIQEILYTSRKRLDEAKEKPLRARKVAFDQLCEKSDVLFVVAKLTAETKNKFDYTAFLKMKQTAIFINVANANIVNQSALVAALKTYQIFAAAIDVVAHEPIKAKDPLLSIPNLIITPNLGSAVEGTRNEMATVAAKNVLNVLQGKDLIAEASQN